MRGFQKCIFAGNLGQDPEVRHTAGGTAVANLSIAVNETWKDKSGQKQERTYWLRAAAFGAVAEIFGEHLSKGDGLLVSGRMQRREWEDRDGNKRHSDELLVDDFTFLGKASGSRSGSRAPAEEFDEDDIPF